jgi:DNA modification methylase/ParB-like chromosome segregation protein Spo0J
MNTIDIKLIKIGERTRPLDTEHRDEILTTFRENGYLLHALCLLDDNTLLAGLHRLDALRLAHENDVPVRYGDDIIPHGQVPFVRFSELTAKQILELELVENIYRKEISWQQRNAALAKIHKKEVEDHGDAATFSATAVKIADATGKSADHVRKTIARAVILSDAMEANPELSKARSETEAFSRLKTDLNARSAALLAGGFALTSTSHRLILGDFREVLQDGTIAEVDTIISDLPYGVGADNWTSKFVDAQHDYKDDWAHAATLYANLFKLGYKVTRDLSNLFAFCAIERWHLIRDMAEDFGWSVWPHPVIWHKSNEGIRPWGQKGYAYCYEAILMATKGQKGLIKTGPDVISNIYKVREREHGAAKPSELYRYLIESASLPGDVVLDPTCGSGPIFPAATLTNTTAIGIEINPHYHGLSLERMNERPAETPAGPISGLTSIEFDDFS